jgi:hypothetical protein
MKEHYVSYGLEMKEKITNIFGNLTSATVSVDQEAISNELEFFVTCSSCY